MVELGLGLLSFSSLLEKVFRVDILHLILLESSNFNFVGVLSLFVFAVVNFLFQFYSDRFRMGEWPIFAMLIFKAFVVIVEPIRPVFFCTIVWILVISELKAAFVRMSLLAGELFVIVKVEATVVTGRLCLSQIVLLGDVGGWRKLAAVIVKNVGLLSSGERVVVGVCVHRVILSVFYPRLA